MVMSIKNCIEKLLFHFFFSFSAVCFHNLGMSKRILPTRSAKKVINSDVYTDKEEKWYSFD